MKTILFILFILIPIFQSPANNNSFHGYFCSDVDYYVSGEVGFSRAQCNQAYTELGYSCCHVSYEDEFYNYWEYCQEIKYSAKAIGAEVRSLRRYFYYVSILCDSRYLNAIPFIVLALLF